MREKLTESKFGDLVVPTPGAEFSVVLSRTIDSIKDDPAQLRNAVYELARIKLQRECMLRTPPMTVLETRRTMLAFEAAIEQIESTSAQRDKLRALESTARTIMGNLYASSQNSTAAQSLITVKSERPVVAENDDSIPTLPIVVDRQPTRQNGNWHRILISLQAGILIALGAILYLLNAGQSGHVSMQTDPHEESDRQAQLPSTSALRTRSFNMRRSTVAQTQTVDDQFQRSELPLPSVYGVYAISDGQLNELEALPGRVPDQRVFMSAAINKASRTILPDGRISFIVYRRDLASSAPDRVAVRVFATIKRAMTFDSAGTVKTASQDGTWAIRNVSYEFRVRPVSGNAEMLLLRSEDPAFALSPGRYVLVLNGQGYDFSVAGTITEPAQCLERTDASNGTFYSECRNP